MDKHNRLAWMDLVVAGLDGPGPCTVELAFAVTDGDLQIVAEGPSAILREPGLSLDPRDDWRHADSGRPGCFDHEPTVDLHQAEAAMLDFLGQHCDPGTPPLAGHAVYRDRPFLHRYMPALDAFLHYRVIDVATIEALVRRWYPAAFAAAPALPESPRAHDHIRASIHELRHFREQIFR